MTCAMRLLQVAQQARARRGGGHAETVTSYWSWPMQWRYDQTTACSCPRHTRGGPGSVAVRLC
jgi:hypothetical protein